MRRIEPGEDCLSASEIAARFANESSFELHPTNVGNAAKKLGLDYVEEPPEDSGWKPRRLYAVADIPLIFEELRALAQHRAQYQNQ